MADKRSKRRRGRCSCCIPSLMARRNKTYQLKETTKVSFRVKARP